MRTQLHVVCSNIHVQQVLVHIESVVYSKKICTHI